MEFLNFLDFELLDEIEFCQIVLDLDLHFELQLNTVAYISHEIHDCGQSLIIQKLQFPSMIECDLTFNY